MEGLDADRSIRFAVALQALRAHPFDPQAWGEFLATTGAVTPPSGEGITPNRLALAPVRLPLAACLL
eukprot:9365888-Pyramimonas_sp.AAC.1